MHLLPVFVLSRLVILCALCLRSPSHSNVEATTSSSGSNKEISGFVIAGSDGGLANRLRALVAYMHIASVVYKAELLFIWDVNDACPGHFLQTFHPIPGVNFITNSSRETIGALAKANIPTTRAHFEYIMMEYDIPKRRYGYISWWEIQTINYGKIRPLPSVLNKANEFIIKHNMCNGSAMHLRQTDLHKILPPKKRMSMQSFHWFVSSRPETESIFLMTDNPEAQRNFLETYPKDKVVVVEVIPTPVNTTSATELPEEFRFTSFEHMVLDVIIAAHAHTFKGSPFSSASDLVTMYKRSHKLICCEDSASVCLI